jgi:hypothetical protein
MLNLSYPLPIFLLLGTFMERVQQDPLSGRRKCLDEKPNVKELMLPGHGTRIH